MSTEDIEPDVPHAPVEPVPSDPLAVTPEPPPPSAKETWVDEPDGQPPALGAEAHGDLQQRLDALSSARRPSAFRRLLNAVFGRDAGG